MTKAELLYTCFSRSFHYHTKLSFKKKKKKKLKNSQSWLRARLQVHSYQKKDSMKQCELWGQGRGKQVSCCIFLIGITVISPAGVIWRWISSLIPVIQALFFIIQTCRLNCNMPSSRMRSASKGTLGQPQSVSAGSWMFCFSKRYWKG